MKKWEEVFKGVIPSDIYQTEIVNSEESGLIIKLGGKNNTITIFFGRVYAVNMMDEGIVQNEWYEDVSFEKFREENFKNVIYEVKDGFYLKLIKNVMDEYSNILLLKHYVVITDNYNIDVITEYEPTIKK